MPPALAQISLHPADRSLLPRNVAAWLPDNASVRAEESNQITPFSGDPASGAKERNVVTHMGGNASLRAEESNQITHIGGDPASGAKERNMVTHMWRECVSACGRE
ncbi:hypothetical protein J19TS2_29570 [Cohnella xylanilytica]|nr:hypothetical protein J19TS2_29570 [Cohnella xylanilytica]